MNTCPTTTALPTSEWRPALDAWHPSLQKAADACARWIADLARGAPPYWLTLLGLPGVGKTLLARQAFTQARAFNPGERSALWLAGHGAYEPHARRPRRVWLHATDFKDQMLGGAYDLPEYLHADFLVAIDDLGAQTDTRDQRLADGLYRLANQRLGRWTLWTSNLSLADIGQKIDARLSSRLIRDDNRLITITAPDYALRPRPAPPAHGS